jgi:hypothetical protein
VALAVPSHSHRGFSPVQLALKKQETVLTVSRERIISWVSVVRARHFTRAGIFERKRTKPLKRFLDFSAV